MTMSLSIVNLHYINLLNECTGTWHYKLTYTVYVSATHYTDIMFMCHLIFE